MGRHFQQHFRGRKHRQPSQLSFQSLPSVHQLWFLIQLPHNLLQQRRRGILSSCRRPSAWTGQPACGRTTQTRRSLCKTSSRHTQQGQVVQTVSNHWLASRAQLVVTCAFHMLLLLLLRSCWKYILEWGCRVKVEAVYHSRHARAATAVTMFVIATTSRQVSGITSKPQAACPAPVPTGSTRRKAVASVTQARTCAVCSCHAYEQQHPHCQRSCRSHRR